MTVIADYLLRTPKLGDLAILELSQVQNDKNRQTTSNISPNFIFLCESSSIFQLDQINGNVQRLMNWSLTVTAQNLTDSARRIMQNVNKIYYRSKFFLKHVEASGE